MNTIVFVLMIYTHGSSFVPTIEFSTLEKYEAARASYQIESAKNIRLGSPGRTWCWRVEK